jgi:hypothetical protein
MKNSTLLTVLLAAGLAAGGVSRAADPGDAAVQSLRGAVPIDAERAPEDLKRWQRDRAHPARLCAAAAADPA